MAESSSNRSVFSTDTTPDPLNETVVASADAIEEKSRASFDEYEPIPDIQAVQYLTQTTRFAIIEAILGHETLPSMQEIANYSPVKMGSVRNTVADMNDVGVLEKHELSGPERNRHQPYTFWDITEDTRSILNEYELLTSEYVEHINSEYQSRPETDTVANAKKATRPTEAKSDRPE